MMQNLDLVIGPASAPLMQSALSDIETWFFVSRIPFWTFGDETPKWQPKVKVFAKDENETWSPLMKASSKQFKIWIKSKT